MNSIDTCDYCNGWIDDGEKTYPVFVGEKSTDKARATARVDKIEQVMGYNVKDKEERYDNGTEQLGERVDYARAIIKALKESSRFEIEKHRAVTEQVEESLGVIGEEEPIDVPSYEINHDRVGVEIVAETVSTDEPDMIVCKRCKNELKGVAND